MATAVTPQITDPTPAPPPSLDAWRSLLAPAAVLGVGLVWMYWPALTFMFDRWMNDPRYSHGFLVPAFAGYLLWSRQEMLLGSEPKPNWWAGLPLLLTGLGLFLVGGRFWVKWVEMISIIPLSFGLVLLLGGLVALKWAWPALAFLGLMVPLPHSIEMALGAPLQRLATRMSTFTLQTLGFPAVAEGNIITLEQAQIGVVEACNGLGMLVMFIAFAAAVALLIQRSWVEKLLVLLSAIPIALLANTARIVITGVLHETVGSKVAYWVYHDLAGWLMMPMALAALGLLLWILSRTIEYVEPDVRNRPPVGIQPIPIVPLGAAYPGAPDSTKKPR